MFAIAYDLDMAATKRAHPKGTRQAYFDIARVMTEHGFKRVQWSVYAAADENLANLFDTIDDLRRMPWFGASVRNVRAFRMEQGSDFTLTIQHQKT